MNRASDLIPIIQERAAAADIAVIDICKRAGVNITTFNRWRAGEVSPTAKKLDAMLDALDVLEGSNQT